MGRARRGGGRAAGERGSGGGVAASGPRGECWVLEEVGGGWWR